MILEGRFVWSAKAVSRRLPIGEAASIVGKESDIAPHSF